MFHRAPGGGFLTLQKANKPSGEHCRAESAPTCAWAPTGLPVGQRGRDVDGRKIAVGLPTFATHDKWHVTGGGKIVKF
jgi:hypothetical protein